MLTRICLPILLLLSTAGSSLPAQPPAPAPPAAGPPAPALQPGNLLFCDGGTLREYTPGGNEVRSYPIPLPTGARAEGVRDLVMDIEGRIHFYNGTFSPHLSTFIPLAEQWLHHTHPGWSTVNNVSYGGIAVIGDAVFVSDMQTAGSGESQGIVRFALPEFTASRLAEESGFTDLAAGQDGLLYALEGEHTVKVYDPASLKQVRRIGLAEGVRAIAADRAGELYGAAWSAQRLYKFGGDGKVLASRENGVGGLIDLDLSATGELAVGTRAGEVLLTDVAFSDIRRLRTNPGRGGIGGFVAWVPSARPETPHPGRLFVSVEDVGFGSLKVGESQEKTLLIRNRGRGVLYGSVQSPVVPFSADPSGGFALKPGAEHRVTVRFAPASRGRFVAGLTVTSGDPAEPRLDVSLSGRAK